MGLSKASASEMEPLRYPVEVPHNQLPEGCRNLALLVFGGCEGLLILYDTATGRFGSARSISNLIFRNIVSFGIRLLSLDYLRAGV